MVEEKEAGSAAKRSRKQLQRRATDEQVERCIADNFKGWSTLETHGTLVGGKSLAQRIADDKRDAKSSNRRLGSSYWQELREMYASSTTMSASLKVQNSSASVSDTLIEAIKFSNCANLTKRTKAPLLTYLASCKSMNQRELCGLLRHLATIRPAASSSATGLVLEGMRCIKRLGMHTKEKGTVDVVRPLFDEALVSAYAAMRREGIPTGHFWEVHGDIASIIVDGSAVQSILNEKGSWISVSDALKKVTAESELGAKMFGFAAEEVVSEEVGVYLNNKLLSLPNESITPAVVKVWMDGVEAELLAKVGVSSLTGPREISLTYRTIPLKVTALSVTDEISVRLACHLKQKAVGGHLPTLAPEAALLPTPEESFAKRAVDQAVVKEWRLARLACNDLLTQQALDAEVGQVACCLCAFGLEVAPNIRLLHRQGPWTGQQTKLSLK